MEHGYARVSSIDQNLDLQLDALNRAGCEKIYKDDCSGSTINRPGLKRCLKALEIGDRPLRLAYSAPLEWYLSGNP